MPLSWTDGFLFAGSLSKSSRTMEATSSASGGIREMVIYAYIEWDQSLLVKGYMRQG